MRVGCQWFGQIELRISTVLDLPQSFKVPQKYVTQPLGVHTWDPPLLCLLVFQPTRPDGIDRGTLTIITKNKQIKFPERYKTITFGLVYIKKHSTLDFLHKETFSNC